VSAIIHHGFAVTNKVALVWPCLCLWTIPDGA